jgi:hypothetical protein
VLAFFALLLTGCETTKLLYDSKVKVEIARLGIADVNKRHPKIDSIFPKLDSNFNAASIKYSNKYLANGTVHIAEKLSYHQPDSLKIITLCSKNNLDAIVVSYIDFRLVVERIYYVPVDKYFESILYSKVYDKTGKLLYHLVHDSKDDSYEKIPNTYDVVNLSVGISYKKLREARQKISGN